MPNGATLSNIRTIDNDLVGVSCKQDLRQDFTPHWTKLDFKVWGSDENNKTGAFICVDSVFKVELDGSASALHNPQNFAIGTVATPNARFIVQGVQSSQCPVVPTENVGLLTVLNSSVTLNTPFGGEDAELGTTLYGAGADMTGFILWDPEPVVPPFAPRR